MKNVLIAVLTSRDEPYPSLMDASLATWAKGRDGVEFYSEPQPNRQTDGILIEVPAAGGLYDMGRKNLLAYDWLLKNKSWDYLARVNASCYVCKKNLMEWVQKLPDTGVCQGVKAPDAHGRIYLWGGGQFILSRDVVQAIVDHADQWDHNEMEDVAMSLLLEKLGYTLDGEGAACAIHPKDGHWVCIGYYRGTHANFEFHTFEQFAEIQQFNFIRVKQDGNRSEDMRIMQELYRCGV